MGALKRGSCSSSPSSISIPCFCEQLEKGIPRLHQGLVSATAFKSIFIRCIQRLQSGTQENKHCCTQRLGKAGFDSAPSPATSQESSGAGAALGTLWSRCHCHQQPGDLPEATKTNTMCVPLFRTGNLTEQEGLQPQPGLIDAAHMQRGTTASLRKPSRISPSPQPLQGKQGTGFIHDRLSQSPFPRARLNIPQSQEENHFPQALG